MNREINREIKFRAWHKKYEYMARVADINFNKERINLNAADIGSFEDIELMQYTGLKDKNSVEIYEGDIIVFISEKRNKKYTIGYDEEDCSFSVYLDGLPYYQLLKSECYDIKVIGNIYENPDLLTL